MKTEELQMQYLRYLTYRGCIERYGMDITDPHLVSGEIQGCDEDYLRERIEHELDTLAKAGFAGYFLLVQDILRFCRERGIPTGPGRGSVCGSAVAYATYITDVDPLRFNIPFERFLHLERIAQPDIDLDICQARRGEVIDYLRSTYGADSVAQIITFTPMAAKGVVQDVCRVLHVDDLISSTSKGSIARELTSQIPDGSGADQYTIDEFIEDGPRGASFGEKIQSLMIPYPEDVRDPHFREISVYETCKVLEGLVRQPSVHAAGVVVADRPLIEVVPLYRKNKDADIQTQFDMRDVEELGLLKLDVLGLRTVTVLGEAERLVRESTKNPKFSIKSVPLDDAATFELLSKGDTGAVFQLEGDGITGACKGMRPDRFEDIVALIALYRPGPMEQLGSYFKRKHGEEEITYAHPLLEDILRPTYGLIVYQEQVMGITRALAGYTAGEADMFRKAIGKKLVPLIRQEIDTFISRAISKGHHPDIVRQIGDQIFHFGRYGFNLGHATGYGFITYWTAYFKARYPAQFFTANLNSQIGKLDKINTLIIDAGRRGISILPPDINKSGRGFTYDHDSQNILFGIGGIKGLGDTVINDIIEERTSIEKNSYGTKRVTRSKDDGTEYKASVRVVERVPNTPCIFEGLYDFCSRLPHVTITIKKALVISGAFGADTLLRRVLYRGVEGLNEAAKRDRKFDIESVEGVLIPEAELIQKERELIGLYVTAHPLAFYRQDIERYGAVAHGQFEDLPTYSTVAGLVTKVRNHQSAKGEMAWVTLDNDIEGMVDVTIFSSLWSGERGKEGVKDKVKEGAVIAARCKKEHHVKFGWGLKASEVYVMDKAIPDAKMAIIVMDDPELSDLVELREMTTDYPEGVPLSLVIKAHNRMVTLNTTRFITLTGATVTDFEERGWKVNMQKVHFDDNDKIAAYIGVGQTRKSIYDTMVIKKAIGLLDAVPTGTYKYESKLSSRAN